MTFCSLGDIVSVLEAFPGQQASSRRRLVHGRLNLQFNRDSNGSTYLGRQYAAYPFHICKVQYHDRAHPDLATVYAQSCSGGLYEDDRHELELTAHAGAQCHFTTQASTIIHGMPAGQARQDMSIAAHAGCYVEYLPDPQILFPQSRFSSVIRIKAADDAAVLVSDAFLVHDPQASRSMPDFYGSEIVVESAAGRTLAIDRLRLDAAALQGRVSGIMGAFGAQGTLLIVCRGSRIEDILKQGRGLSADYGQTAIGVSVLPNDAGLFFRVLTHDGVALKRAMHAIWSCARLVLKGDHPQMRRK
ncbi:MAG: urease accessory protein UreD [Hyphomicrobiales bacterium]